MELRRPGRHEREDVSGRFKVAEIHHFRADGVGDHLVESGLVGYLIVDEDVIEQVRRHPDVSCRSLLMLGLGRAHG